MSLLVLTDEMSCESGKKNIILMGKFDFHPKENVCLNVPEFFC